VNRKDIVRQVKEIYCDRLKLAYSPDTLPDQFLVSTSGLSLDSVESLELVIGIEQAFGIAFESSEIDLSLMDSPGRMIDVVLGKLKDCEQDD
jgi:acyl carrier protein